MTDTLARGPQLEWIAGLTRRGGIAVLVAMLWIAALMIASPAPAQPSAREDTALPGAGLGGRDCADVSSADFEAVGERVMERMVGSRAAHESIDDAMNRMMGRAATRQMHISMGRRFAACGGGGAYAGMIGMMSMMGGGPGPYAGALGPGAMMGGLYGDRYRGERGDGDWGTAAIVVTALMGVLIPIVAVALWRQLPRQRPGRHGAVEILDRRYAAGEIDGDDYTRRKRALEGSR